MADHGRIDSDRVRQRMDELGLSQNGLAQKVGVSQAAIAKITSGQSFGSKHLHRIARELGTTAAFLTGETDDPSEGALPVPTADDVADQVGGVRIKEIDLDYGMGASWIEGVPVTEVERVFPADWLVQFTRAHPQYLFFAHGAGDSMMPTIMDRDIVLIDTTQQTLNMADRIWAVAFGGAGMIKRLRPQPDGGVKLMSDNPSVRDEVAYDGELSIIGRVVAVMRKI
ncbi:XRE family transcriptional regulator [Blastomonas sp.]|uniref:XRE family transcriptional regulator n=1 Tax=Blastomonas sp. TaxID=1909299 RepID=UPI00406A6FAB